MMEQIKTLKEALSSKDAALELMKEKLKEAAQAQAENLSDSLKQAAQEQVNNLGAQLAEARAKIEADEGKKNGIIEAQNKEIASLAEILKHSRQKLDDALHHRAQAELQL